MIYVLVFIFGTIIGSFLNVVILRYNTGESIVFFDSRCFSCGKKLKWSELIPILSFVLQKGRCRECRSKISWQYPIVEAITGIAFVLIFWKVWNLEFGIWNLFGIWDLGFGIWARWLLVTGYWLLIASFLIIISVYDLRHQIIPNKFVYFFILLSCFSFVWDFGNWDLFSAGGGSAFGGRNLDLGFVWKLEIENWKLAERILTGLGAFAFFGLLWLLSKGRWMGLGDAKLALGIGWLLGFPAGIIALILSFWFGAIVGVFLLFFRPKSFTMKSRIPFGPFLCLGTMVAFLFSGNLLKVYFSLFNL